MSWPAFAGWFVVALVGMEGVAYLSHRFLMHGPLWFLHRSHHEPHRGGWEWNDLFGLGFSVPAMLCIKMGVDGGGTWPLPVGLGMTAYGVLYVVFHDIIVHRRLPVRRLPHWSYLRRITLAHLAHHKTHGREGAVSFGFLWAPRAHAARRRDGTGAAQAVAGDRPA
jgi:beta-carotene 3-hydroxylase